MEVTSMLLMQLYTVLNEKEKEKVDKNEVRRIVNVCFRQFTVDSLYDPQRLPLCEYAVSRNRRVVK